MWLCRCAQIKPSLQFFISVFTFPIFVINSITMAQALRHPSATQNFVTVFNSLCTKFNLVAVYNNVERDKGEAQEKTFCISLTVESFNISGIYSMCLINQTLFTVLLFKIISNHWYLSITPVLGIGKGKKKRPNTRPNRMLHSKWWFR
jgi:hypothetical protein